MSNLIHGDCIEEIKKLPDNSVDAIITDPPYGLEFMGKDWDKFKNAENIGGGTMGNRNTPYQRGDKTPPAYYIWTLEQKNEFQIFSMNWAKECLRVLKPGGYLLSFGGTRTYHRMACGIEDAGFEIRDTIMWVYGSGFPKSLNIAKAIDKMEGVEHPKNTPISDNGSMSSANYTRNKMDVQSELAKQHEGWGTALKPAVEPIVVARKPLSEKNVALNVLKWGTGGINIDECRIGYKNWEEEADIGGNFSKAGKEYKDTMYGGDVYLNSKTKQTHAIPNQQGRFPANLILDEEAGRMLDEQTGNIGCSSDREKYKGSNYGTSMFLGEKPLFNSPTYTDKGGASRFFYCPKASKSERNLGCEELEGEYKSYVKNRRCKKCGYQEVSGSPCKCENPEWEIIEREVTTKNNHPTIKPIALMEYLIKLVSRENAIVLDPFLGSGTTAIACLKTNRKFIGIEKEPEYIKIAQARIKPYLEQRKLLLEEKQDKNI